MIAAGIVTVSPAQAGAPAGAADAVSIPPGTVLQVVALYNPPFAFRGRNGVDGLSVTMLNRVAADNHWTVHYTLEPTIERVLNALVAHRASIAIGGIAPTPQIGYMADFTDAFEVVPLALLVKREKKWPLLERTFVNATGAYLSSEILVLIAIGVIATLIFGYYVRQIEKGVNDQTFPAEFRHNAWWAAQTLVAHNCGNKLPVSERGRYLALFLMLAGTLLTAQLTAVFTNRLSQIIASSAPVTGIGTVGKRPLATVANSFASYWLQDNLLRTQTYPTIDDCLAAFRRGEVVGVAYDAVSLSRIVANSPASNNWTLAGNYFGLHPFVFLVAQWSGYTPALNAGLRKLLSSPEWPAINERWLGHSYDDIMG